MGGMWLYKCLHGEAGRINGHGVTQWQEEDGCSGSNRFQMEGRQPEDGPLRHRLSGGVSTMDWILRQVTTNREPRMTIIRTAACVLEDS